MAREEERVGLPLPRGAFLLQLKIPLVARITSCTFDLFAVEVKEAPAAVTGTRRTACTYTATAAMTTVSTCRKVGIQQSL